MTDWFDCKNPDYSLTMWTLEYIAKLYCSKSLSFQVEHAAYPSHFVSPDNMQGLCVQIVVVCCIWWSGRPAESMCDLKYSLEMELQSSLYFGITAALSLFSKSNLLAQQCSRQSGLPVEYCMNRAHWCGITQVSGGSLTSHFTSCSLFVIHTLFLGPHAWCRFLISWWRHATEWEKHGFVRVYVRE